MAYVKAQGGQTTYPYSIGQLRKDHPNTSFPKSIPDATLAAYGVYAVTVQAPPAYNSATQKVAEDAMPTEVGGAWVVGWSVADLAGDELAARLAEVGAAVRGQRDLLLSETDWTANSDVVMSDAMKAYRQALRDIPQQAGFPQSVVWPTKPE